MISRILTIALVFFSSIAMCQNLKKDKALADSLVNLWNVNFDSDIPKNVENIITENVSMISGDYHTLGKSNIMNDFVIMRMPIIRSLNAVTEYYHVTDDMIYTSGKYTLEVKRDETLWEVAEGNFTFVWVKQTDNSFKIDNMHIESVKKEK